MSSSVVRDYAATLGKGAVRPEGLATAGAMLTCVAIVLNLGPFAPAPRTDAIPALAAVPVPQLAPARQVAVAPEPDRVAAPASADRPLLWVASAEAMPFQPVAAYVDTHEPRPEPADADAAADHAPADSGRPASIVGVWSPDGGTCSARNFKDGTLPTVINAEGAWAGETFCIFTKRKETETGWRVVAKCSTPRARWTSNVRLTVNDNRLTWTSERGTQAYARCAADVLMAQAR